MEKELVTKWAAALRSGNYKQARHTLRSVGYPDSRRDGYCCLGVLCDIVDPEGWDDEVGSEHRLATDGSMLTPKATRDLGLTSRFSRSKKANQKRLASLNDNGLSDFEQIADYIEKEFGYEA